MQESWNPVRRRCVNCGSEVVEYATEKASVEELKSQHSYFIDSLYRDGNDGQGGRSV